MERGERVAQNEILFRQVNERILEIETDSWRVDPIDFMCECGDLACTRVLQLTTDEYERLRADPKHFGVIPGHELPDVEHELPDVEEVVETRPHYLVVEKFGELGQRAAEMDP